MGISRILGLCAAFLFASTLANASTINVGPSNYQNFGPSATHTGGGVQSTFGQNVRLPPTVSGPTRLLPVSRNAVIPYGSIANGAKNFLRVNPQSVAASAALTALFLGLDWVFDPEVDSWMKEGESTIEYVDPIEGGFGTPQNIFPTADAYCASTSFCERYGACTALPPEGSYGWCAEDNGQIRNQYAVIPVTCPPGSAFMGIGCGIVIEGEYEDLTESDWAELEAKLPATPAGQVAEAASDIQQRQGAPLPGYQDLTMTGPSSVSGPGSTSTSTDPVTGDTTVTTTNTTTNISYGDTTITTTNTTTTTIHQNGQETSTTVTTETPGDLSVPPGGGGGGGGGVWPEFCEWASVVCEWLDWTREEPPPEQDLPSVIDDDFYQEKTISFGAKSCPPDHEISLAPFMPTAVAVSFQPLCDFAGLIYYMVMAASYIIAAYITIGVARNG